MISIDRHESFVLAYLIESPNTNKQHTHGSVSGQTKGEAIAKALRMAHQKSLSPSIFFDEDEQKHIPVIPFDDYDWRSVKKLYDMNIQQLFNIDGTVVDSRGRLSVCALPLQASHGELVDKIHNWQHSLLKNLEG